VDKSRSKRTGGYGLGLSLCKTIMEAHGAKITVDSSPGKGTSILLHFQEVYE
jgi:signal transduction histidine kinase